MTDLYFSESGDIAVSPSGDVAVTQANWRDDVQQTYIRMMTDIGDYLLYQELGADLSQLYGRPQSEATGNYGIALIEAALEREGRFIGKPIEVKAVPTGYQSIRFDVFVKSGSRNKIKLSIEQNLGVS
jgi:hypothetical protein